MKRPPKLCHHKKKGYAFVYVGTKQVYLGRWGSLEAQTAYDRFLEKWAKSNQELEGHVFRFSTNRPQGT